jgi:ATP-binding cassette subfamily F protein 3
MRLQLARALMCPSDLMLLDEPTNHLDLDALVWLESWLQRYNGTLVIISHDREFLDAVTKVTLHIDHGQITRYGANYSGFETLRTQELILQQAAYAKQQDRINHLQNFIDRFKAKASKAKQAQSRVKALERMEKMSPMLNEADFTFEFKEPLQLPNPMIAIQEGSFGYKNGDESTVILSGVGRSVLSGQRIGILGANGQGKSTFIKTLSQSIPLVSGEMVQGKGLNIGYFAQQELDVLRPEQSALEHMQDLARKGVGSSKEQEIRNFLGTFRFADAMVHQAVGTLSGGEKARLVLAMIVWQRPNLLLLDEPTNHLDLMTREALAMALNDFEGTVMLVSHDRSLLRAVCEEFWLVSRSGIADFKGDLDEYQRYLIDQSKALKDEQSGKKTGKNNPSSPSSTNTQDGSSSNAGRSRQDKKLDSQKRSQLQRERQALLSPVKKELQETESRLQAVQLQLQNLEASLMEDLSPQERAQNGKTIKSLQEEANELEEKWLQLGERIEQLST